MFWIIKRPSRGQHEKHATVHQPAGRTRRSAKGTEGTAVPQNTQLVRYAVVAHSTRINYGIASLQ